MKNKRFLLCQPMVDYITGSTVVTVELAEYLKTQGAKVEIYSYSFGSPMKEVCEKNNIKLTSADDHPEYRLRDFDYIWVNSQTLPVSIINDLARPLPKKMPKFIFDHMSSLDIIPDERPYIYQLEQRLSSKTLSMSPKTRDIMARFFPDSTGIDLGLFRNPAPVEFSESKFTPRAKLKNVLIVSNHPPKELIVARETLKSRGIQTTLFGDILSSDSYKLVTEKILRGFDAVVTIGKTAQYCMTMGQPVYIYDHFGGPGYLTAENYENVMINNFSGRGGYDKKTPTELADDIIASYGTAVKYHQKNRAKFIREFSIDKVLPPLLKSVKSRKIEQFDEIYADVVVQAQEFAKNRFMASTWLFDKDHVEIPRLHRDIELLRRELDDKTRELSDARAEIARISASRALKVGRAVVYPATLAKIAVKKIAKKRR